MLIWFSNDIYGAEIELSIINIDSVGVLAHSVDDSPNKLFILNRVKIFHLIAYFKFNVSQSLAIVAGISGSTIFSIPLHRVLQRTAWPILSSSHIVCLRYDYFVALARSWLLIDLRWSSTMNFLNFPFEFLELEQCELASFTNFLTIQRDLKKSKKLKHKKLFSFISIKTAWYFLRLCFHSQQRQF